MEVISTEEALKLITKPGRAPGAGRPNIGKQLVEGFLATGALFGRERFTNEQERKAKMLSVKKYIKDANMDTKIWVVADGASIMFTNMTLAAKAEADTKKEVTEAFKKYRDRYANVGKKAGK